MKLNLATPDGIYTVTGYGPGYLAINGVRHEQPLLLRPDAPPAPWPAANLQLSAEALALLTDGTPEIIILGTGTHQQFLGPETFRTLAAAGIGAECMSTAAACRTYNLLAAEGRRVIAAMLLP